MRKIDPHSKQNVRRTLKRFHRALEELESALVEFEEALDGESTIRPDGRKGLNLLSIPEVCQEIGMGKSFVYKKIRSGEIPSVKLGRREGGAQRVPGVSGGPPLPPDPRGRPARRRGIASRSLPREGALPGRRPSPPATRPSSAWSTTGTA